MEKNYTPIDIGSLYPKKEVKDTDFSNLSNTILLILATLTVLVLAIVFFVIIQKNQQSHAGIPTPLSIAFLDVFFHG